MGACIGVKGSAHATGRRCPGAVNSTIAAPCTAFSTGESVRAPNLGSASPCLWLTIRPIPNSRANPKIEAMTSIGFLRLCAGTSAFFLSSPCDSASSGSFSRGGERCSGLLGCEMSPRCVALAGVAGWSSALSRRLPKELLLPGLSMGLTIEQPGSSALLCFRHKRAIRRYNASKWRL